MSVTDALLFKCQCLYLCMVGMSDSICEYLNVCNMHTSLVSRRCHGSSLVDGSCCILHFLLGVIVLSAASVIRCGLVNTPHSVM